MLPGWMDKTATAEVMCKRIKITTNHVNRDNFVKQSTKAFRCGKYDTAFKKASLELEGYERDDRRRGKHIFGALGLGC